MNKNDLRFIKTEDLIISTYEEMLRTNRKAPNVTQLCKTARINTSTFYTHYVDIEELHSSLCKQRLGELLDSEPALSLLYENPGDFVGSLNRLYTDHKETLGPFFEKNQELMVDIVEKRLLKIYAGEKNPEMSEIQVRFCVGGAMRILSAPEGEKNTTEVVEIIKGITKKQEYKENGIA